MKKKSTIFFLTTVILFLIGFLLNVIDNLIARSVAIDVSTFSFLPPLSIFLFGIVVDKVFILRLKQARDLKFFKVIIFLIKLLSFGAICYFSLNFVNIKGAFDSQNVLEIIILIIASLSFVSGILHIIFPLKIENEPVVLHNKKQITLFLATTLILVVLYIINYFVLYESIFTFGIGLSTISLFLMFLYISSKNGKTNKPLYGVLLGFIIVSAALAFFPYFFMIQFGPSFLFGNVLFGILIIASHIVSIVVFLIECLLISTVKE